MSKIDRTSQIILQRIRTNEYTGKIPGERSLALEFGIDFKTANRAIATLVEQGILVRRRGLGTFIAPLDQRRGLTIGLCFFKFSDPGRDPVFTRFFAGINRAIMSLGIRLDATSLFDVASAAQPFVEQRAQFRKQVLASNPDALIYLGNVDTQLIDSLRSERPTIVVTQTPDALQFDSVRRDVAGGVADAVRHLHQSGHRRIALATYLNEHSTISYDLIEKENGYRTAIVELGLPEQVFRLTHQTDMKLPHLIRAADSRPTAIVCTESTLGQALLDHGPRLGLVFPDDLAVISFDDGDQGLVTKPTLSGIVAFGEELAQRAVQAVLDKLDGRTTGRINVVLACPFIERESSRVPAHSEA